MATSKYRVVLITDLLTNLNNDVIILATSGRHFQCFVCSDPQFYCFIKMTKITADDRNLIKNLRIEKHWGAWRMKTEFPNKTRV